MAIEQEGLAASSNGDSVMGITLPAVLDLRAAATLKDSPQPLAGAPLDRDATKVERLGGLCLKILLAIGSAWGSAGHVCRMVDAGDAFKGDVRLMGAIDLLNGSGDGRKC